MNTRKCRLWLEIDNGQTCKRYSVLPLASAEIGADFVLGFRLVNRSEDPSPLYCVRVTLAGAVVCDCPSFGWDKRKGESPKAPPDQPPPTCKHCDSLRASGVLPSPLLNVLHARTMQLDLAERTVKNREVERENTLRNVDALQRTIATLESKLQAVEGRALQLQTALAAQQTATMPPRRRRKQAA